ncbi:MAG: hypothetical protein AAGA68_21685 [Pseudomonadota bacterium]
MFRHILRLPTLLIVWGLVGAAAAGEAKIYRCNYDVVLELGGESHSVHHQDSVRNGSYIPIRLRGVELQIRLTEHSAKAVSATVSVVEIGTSGGQGQTLAEHEFLVQLGVPVREAWTEGDLSVDSALVVSRLQR